jgi:hypothetical protein
MGIHYTPAKPSGLDPKLEEELEEELDRQAEEIFRPTAEVLGPRMAEEANQERITDLLYDAAAKGDKAEFYRLWQTHMVPLARQREAEAANRTPDSPTPTPAGKPK